MSGEDQPFRVLPSKMRLKRASLLDCEGVRARASRGRSSKRWCIVVAFVRGQLVLFLVIVIVLKRLLRQFEKENENENENEPVRYARKVPPRGRSRRRSRSTAPRITRPSTTFWVKLSTLSRFIPFW